MAFYNRFAYIKIQSPVEETLQVAELPVVKEPDGFGKAFKDVREYRLSLYNQAVSLGLEVKKTFGADRLRKILDDHSTRHNHVSS